MDRKTCIECGIEKPSSDFYPAGKYLNSRCKPCCNEASRRYGMENHSKRNARLRAWRRANPEAARAKDLRARLRRKYNLTPEDVEQMRTMQGGRCLLCDAVTRELVVDHHHETGLVRGMLCRSCNTIVGQVELAPAILERLADYVAHGIASPGLASSSKTSA